MHEDSGNLKFRVMSSVIVRSLLEDLLPLQKCRIHRNPQPRWCGNPALKLLGI